MTFLLKSCGEAVTQEAEVSRTWMVCAASPMLYVLLTDTQLISLTLADLISSPHRTKCLRQLEENVRLAHQFSGPCLLSHCFGSRVVQDPMAGTHDIEMPGSREQEKGGGVLLSLSSPPPNLSLFL